MTEKSKFKCQKAKVCRIPWITYYFSTRKEDLARLVKELGFDLEDLVLMNQVHSNNVRIVGCGEAGTIINDVDGLVTKESDVFLGVQTADCVPILFVDTNRKIVGAAHAGWKGTLNGVAGNVVEVMKSLGSETKDILAVFGPSIGLCHFEVKEDVRKLFEARFGSDSEIIIERNRKIFIDLRKANRRLLTEVGLHPNNIEVIDRCTYCESQNFYSHRRDREVGRQFGIIGMGA